MNRDPAVLFYSGDFLNGVIDMTMEERGIYITLLCLQHQKGHIQEKTIRFLAPNITDVVLSHFKIDENGLYYNQRMEDEMIKRHNFTESRRQNGCKGGRPKQENNKPSEITRQNLVVNHMDNHMGNENININNNINNSIYYSNNKELNNIFIEYLNIRKKLKAVNSERAIKMLIKKLEPYDDDTKYKMIEQSIIGSWKDIYKLKDYNIQSKSSKEIKPEWFDKKYEIVEDEEKQQELENIIKNYKR